MRLQHNSTSLNFSALLPRAFAVGLVIAMAAVFACPATAQQPMQARQSKARQSGVVKYLTRLDRNRNEILEKDEMVGNAANYLQSQGFDTSRPLSLSQVLRKFEGNADDSKDEKATKSAVVRKVPGFGVEPTERVGVSKFGASGSNGIDMQSKYGDRVMKLVERTLDGYDANKNGHLDPDEIKRARWGNPKPQQSDSNKDGVLTKIELAERYLARDRDSGANRSANVRVSNRARVTTTNDNSSRGRSATPRSRSRTQTSTQRPQNFVRSSGNRSVPLRSTSNNRTASSSSERYARYAAGLMTQYDANKDGKLDKSELGKMRRPPKNADVNKDGYVTQQELTDTLSGKSDPTTAAGASAAAKQLKEAQTRAQGASRSRSSSNRSTSNRPASRSRRVSGSFAELDENQDGQIQMHEFTDDWDGDIFAQFQGKDLNGDGIITSDEWNGR